MQHTRRDAMRLFSAATASTALAAAGLSALAGVAHGRAPATGKAATTPQPVSPQPAPPQSAPPQPGVQSLRDLASAPGHTMPASAEAMFSISLAQWSLHKELYAGKLKHLDFPALAKSEFDITAVEYVNSFFEQKQSADYNKQLRQRCDDAGVTSVLIMCDGEGDLGDPDAAKRSTAASNHQKWLDAAAALGCHSIRVNAASRGTFAEQQRLAADGLTALCRLAEPLKLGVIVENHGGFSSDGKWLAGVMKLSGHRLLGTLPDFGNFNISQTQSYDRYLGTSELMPFAKGVSAKSHDFDAATGQEATKDYARLLRIVYRAGYRAAIGIEYEGGKTAEREGIKLTKSLLEKTRAALFAELTAKG